MQWAMGNGHIHGQDAALIQKHTYPSHHSTRYCVYSWCRVPRLPRPRRSSSQHACSRSRKSRQAHGSDPHANHADEIDCKAGNQVMVRSTRWHSNSNGSRGNKYSLLFLPPRISFSASKLYPTLVTGLSVAMSNPDMLGPQ